MHFKLIVVMVEDQKTEAVLEAAREAGATGATVLNQARGEGLKPAKTFFGLSIESQGIALQVDVEDAVGVRHQIKALTESVEEEL
jgi:nitrogen regulatory protein PII